MPSVLYDKSYTLIDFMRESPVFVRNIVHFVPFLALFSLFCTKYRTLLLIFDVNRLIFCTIFRTFLVCHAGSACVPPSSGIVRSRNLRNLIHRWLLSSRHSYPRDLTRSDPSLRLRRSLSTADGSCCIRRTPILGLLSSRYSYTRDLYAIGSVDPASAKPFNRRRQLSHSPHASSPPL